MYLLGVCLIGCFRLAEWGDLRGGSAWTWSIEASVSGVEHSVHRNKPVFGHAPELVPASRFPVCAPVSVDCEES